jgi:serine/threonine protein kinase
MGLVVLARQVRLGRPVAIKFLSIDDPSGIGPRAARFRREAELMARISHPNILSIYDSGEIDELPYLVMEYVEGGDLRRLMRPGRPMMPTSQACSILSAVAGALGHLHRVGILHRDLKPENILMHDGDNPKVADFGLAVLRAPAPSPRPRRGSARSATWPPSSATGFGSTSGRTSIPSRHSPMSC